MAKRLAAFLPAVVLSWQGTVSLLGTDIPNRLSMTDAVTIALSQHPTLLSADASVAAAGGLQRQSVVRPNPILSLQTENWRFSNEPPFTPGQDVDFFAYVAQPFETSGKRERRRDVADADRAIAELEKRALEWRIRQQVRLAFLRALLAQKELELIGENLGFYGQVSEFHRIRFQEGAIAEADLIRVKLEEERAQVARDLASVEAQRTRFELLSAMGTGTSSGRFELIDPAFFKAVDGGLPLEELLKRAEQSRLEILIAEKGVEAAEARTGLEKALSRPNWSLLLGYKRTAGFNTLLAGVEVPLPIFDKNEGNVLFRRFQVDAAKAQLEARKREVRTEVERTVAALRRLYVTLSGMEAGMLARAELSRDIALAAYREGATDLLRLLDAQRARNEILLLHTRTKLELELSMAALEGAVGEENLMIGQELLSEAP